MVAGEAESGRDGDEGQTGASAQLKDNSNIVGGGWGRDLGGGGGSVSVGSTLTSASQPQFDVRRAGK